MAVVVVTAPSSAHRHTDPSAHADRTPATRDGKTLVHHRHRARVLLRAAYDEDRWRDRSPAKGAEKRAWQKHRRAILIRKVRLEITEYRRKQARKFEAHRAAQRAAAASDCIPGVTVYAGGGGCWSIPAEIVACESGYSWSAANPSGAIGPYQLLGKGAVWPVRTVADKREHHRIAANLYAGGAGRSHWVC